MILPVLYSDVSKYSFFFLVSTLLIFECNREWKVAANSLQRCIAGFSCIKPNFAFDTSFNKDQVYLSSKHSTPYSTESNLYKILPLNKNSADLKSQRQERWNKEISPSKTATALNLFFGSGASSGSGNEAFKNIAQPNMLEAMKKATDLLAKLKVTQESVAKMECKASDGEEGSMITVVYTGSGEPQNIEIQEGAMLQGAEQLQKRIYKLMREAWKIAGEKQSSEYSSLYKEFGLPIQELKKMMSGFDFGSIMNA